MVFERAISFAKCEHSGDALGGSGGVFVRLSSISDCVPRGGRAGRGRVVDLLGVKLRTGASAVRGM